MADPQTPDLFPSLTLDQRRELANDPRMQDLEQRRNVYSVLQPQDQQWLQKVFDAQAQAQQQKSSSVGNMTDLPGLLKSALTTGAGAVGEGAMGLGRWAKNNPGAAGAVLGSIATIPLGVGEMTLGPALATAFGSGVVGSQLGNITSLALDPKNSPAPRTVGGAVNDAGWQGFWNLLGEGGGRLVNGGLQGTGRALMRNVIGDQASHIADMPQAEVGNAVDWLLQNRINPSMPASAERGAGLAATADDVRNAAYQAAGQRGVSAERAEVAQSLGPSTQRAIRNAATNPGHENDINLVSQQLNKIFRKPVPVGASMGQPIMGVADVPLNAGAAQDVLKSLDEAGQAARAAEGGTTPPPLPSQIAHETSLGIRRNIGAQAPEVTAADKVAQTADAGARIARNVSQNPSQFNLRAMRMGAGMGSGAGAGAVTGMLLGHPAIGATVGSALGGAAVGIPRVSAATAIGLYQMGRIPPAMLAQLIGRPAAEIVFGNEKAGRPLTTP